MDRLFGIFVIVGGKFIKLGDGWVVVVVGLCLLGEVLFFIGFVVLLEFVCMICCCVFFGEYFFFRVVSVFIMFWKLFEMLLSWVRRLFFSMEVFVMFVILIFVIILLFLVGLGVFGWSLSLCLMVNVEFCLNKRFLYLVSCSFWLVVSLIYWELLIRNVKDVLFFLFLVVVIWKIWFIYEIFI